MKPEAPQTSQSKAESSAMEKESPLVEPKEAKVKDEDTASVENDWKSRELIIDYKYNLISHRIASPIRSKDLLVTSSTRCEFLP